MKILVSYFSASGVTKNAATKLAKLLNGNLEEIKPVSKYTKDDLNWNNKNSRSSLEMENENARPEIIKPLHNLDYYDFVFIGYPIWWSDMPMILYTFFDEYDLSGKTIVPFGTHGGSGFAGTIDTISILEPNARVIENGLTVSRDDIENAENEIVAWVKGLDL